MSNEELAGKRPEELFPPEHADRVIGNYNTCLFAKHSIECMDYLDAPEGRRWARNHLAPIFDEEGRVVRLIGTAIEITAQINAERLKEETAKALQEALAKVLSGYISICASCKKVRRKDGSWIPVEVYVWEKTEAEFSHGICQDCARRLYPDYYENGEMDRAT